jgi:hypothetical protein
MWLVQVLVALIPAGLPLLASVGVDSLRSRVHGGPSPW